MPPAKKGRQRRLEGPRRPGRREKKNVPHGAHISTFNNTIVTITDPQRHCLGSTSASRAPGNDPACGPAAGERRRAQDHGCKSSCLPAGPASGRDRDPVAAGVSRPGGK